MRITHRAFIACPPARVWEVTTDINSWPDWTPTVQTAYRVDRQRFGIGSQARIKQPMQARTLWTVTAFEEGRCFTWENSGGAFRMAATHRVESHAGGTISTLRVKLSGPAALLCSGLLVPLIWLALMRETRGLKRWCEMKGHSAPDRPSDGAGRISDTAS